MKLTIDRQDLADAVSFVARMSPKRPTQIILGGVLLNASAEDLKLTVYDYEIAADTSIVASVSNEGTALVHAATLAQLVAKLPQKPVTLEAAERELKVTCGAVRASLPLMPVEEYPQLDLTGEHAATVSGAVFEDAVQRVASSASNAAETPVIMGIHVLIDDSGVTLAATDRYRVAHMPIPCETARHAELNVAAPVMREAAKAFGPSAEVAIGVTANDAVTIRGERGTIMARMISGNYPPVARLFPKSPLSTAVFDRDVMSEATSRATLALEPEGVVKYTFAPDACTVLGTSGTDGRGVSESFEVEFDSDELTVSLKPQFVIDGLNGCRAESVSIWFSHTAKDSKPASVMFTAGDGFRYLLQPNLLLKRGRQ